MVSIDRRSHAARSSTGHHSLQALATPLAWQVVALLGLVLVFIGLGVDAWRHNSPGAGEESLLSFKNPGHSLAAAGLAVTAIGVLISISLSAAGHARAARSATPMLAVASVAWVMVIASAVGTVTYIAASDTTVGHAHAPGTGALGAASLPPHVHAAGAHDHGPHATFTQTMNLSDADVLSHLPAGTMSAEDLPLLRAQLRDAATAATRFPTVAEAEAAGYRLTTTDVDYMGLHYLNIEHVTDGVFDASRPEGLLFSRIDGPEPTLVGVWFLQAPGVGDVSYDVEPEGFAGKLDYWHGHQNVCLPFETEGGTEDDCAALGGRFLSDTRWMMHAWVRPEASENPDGVFAYLNRDLRARQLAFSGSDPDSDADGLRDGQELGLRLNPISSDTDGDAVPDGSDASLLRTAISALPEEAFESIAIDERRSVLTLVDAADQKLSAGDIDGALTELEKVRSRLDGCALHAVGSQWMQACAAQAAARELIDLLLQNLES